jgi:tRNA threonylcarbamoyladenosine biosynthesis protein TsaB
MRILAIDTTTEACSAALLLGENSISRTEEPGRGHADRILKMVDEILSEGGVALSAIDVIAACIGTGAFTGVRICIATAQGLAFGAGLKVVPVVSLEALAFARMQRGAPRVLACLDARMNEVYWGCYLTDSQRGLRAGAGPALSTPSNVKLPADAHEPAGAYAAVGRGFSAYPQLLQLAAPGSDAGDLRLLPDARAVAELGALRARAGEAIDPDALSPLYLRDNVALTEAQRGVH